MATKRKTTKETSEDILSRWLTNSNRKHLSHEELDAAGYEAAQGHLAIEYNGERFEKVVLTELRNTPDATGYIVVCSQMDWAEAYCC